MPSGLYVFKVIYEITGISEALKMHFRHVIKEGYNREGNVKTNLVYQLFYLNVRFLSVEMFRFVLLYPFFPKFVLNVPENSSEKCCLLNT